MAGSTKTAANPPELPDRDRAGRPRAGVGRRIRGRGARLRRTPGLQDRRHLVPPARLLGPHRPAAALARRRGGQRHPAALLVPRPRRAEGDQEPARRRPLAADRAQGDRVPARPPRRGARVRVARARRLPLGARAHRRGHRRRGAPGPGRAEHRPARRAGRAARREHPRARTRAAADGRAGRRRGRAASAGGGG